MTPGGWLIMILAVGGMTLFLAWCVYKIVSHPGSESHMHTQADIKPPDTERS